MSALDSVMQMQQRGMSDSDIITSLRNQGISPQEINDALNQAKIKNAVYDNPVPSGQEIMGMQESIMQDTSRDFSSEISQTTQAQSQNPNVYQYPKQQIQQQVPQEGETQYYPDSQYQEAYYQPQQTLDTDTITEIAEQVVSEKFSAFEKRTGDIASFRNDVEERIRNLDERLKRIEDSIARLQSSVIGKIGEFGNNTEAIHKDLDNLHNTVSKLMNPLIDNYKELKRITRGK